MDRILHGVRALAGPLSRGTSTHSTRVFAFRSHLPGQHAFSSTLEKRSAALEQAVKKRLQAEETWHKATDHMIGRALQLGITSTDEGAHHPRMSEAMRNTHDAYFTLQQAVQNEEWVLQTVREAERTHYMSGLTGNK